MVDVEKVRILIIEQNMDKKRTYINIESWGGPRVYNEVKLTIVVASLQQKNKAKNEPSQV